MENIFDMYDCLCTNLRPKLRSRIKGYIKVEANSWYDRLYINIDNDGFKFKFVIDDLVDKLLAGLSSDDILKMVQKQYTKEIMAKYFYKEEAQA